MALAALGAAGPVKAASETAFVGCRIVPSADALSIADGVLVIREGRIAAVGARGRTKVPAGAERISCNGGTLLPGFWNSHVHFMGPEWRGAERLPATRLSAQLADMLTRYGFAHVVDTGSDLANTLSIRRRILSGEVRGPGIITAGGALVGPTGTPFYVTDGKLAELHDAEQARRLVAQSIRAGAGAVKLMSVSLTREQPFPSIPAETIRAVADEAHRAGVKVLVHPTNRRGVELAIDGGADVLLHTAPIGGPWDARFAEHIVGARVALVPTLKLWGYEAAKTNDTAMAQHFAEVAQQQVAAFRKAGGRILFGTDVGYMTDFDPADEYLQMHASGMAARDILASLTTNPVRTFGAPARQGRLAPGYDADLVLVNGNPETDVKAFADVRRAYRAGRRIDGGARPPE
ncbi:amidohydrolase family protein [Sphingosinicella sp. BN140058]|uniref:amidohydrolase family protein n=1 Tax=Sphingosinicella sp. BN140058 TaxID=1892855 RepID=UPI001011E91F|nr:amidohydrolase family protein [Sphingosinicella sp. BN140058]QAY76461.1 4-alpha-glucanotransferase [Sphingosinicella sp. BN140058]